jgi:hypothetical protein
MTYKYEFPDFDYDLPDLGAGWVDNSWHNDVCPSLDYKIGTDEFGQEKVLRIWFDYANPEMREIAEKRYVLAMGVYGESLDHVMTSDDLQDVLDYIKTNNLLAEQTMIGKHIVKITTEDTGGHCDVDFVHLPDGRVIGIDENCAVLYASMQDFYDFETVDRQNINLYNRG